MAKDGRLFASERGNVVAASWYSRVRKADAGAALLPPQVSSVLAARPYDLRSTRASPGGSTPACPPRKRLLVLVTRSTRC